MSETFLNLEMKFKVVDTCWRGGAIFLQREFQSAVLYRGLHSHADRWIGSGAKEARGARGAPGAAGAADRRKDLFFNVRHRQHFDGNLGGRSAAMVYRGHTNRRSPPDHAAA